MHPAAFHLQTAVAIPRATRVLGKARSTLPKAVSHSWRSDIPRNLSSCFHQPEGHDSALLNCTKGPEAHEQIPGIKGDTSRQPKCRRSLLSSLIFAALKQDQARSTLRDKHTAGMRQPPGAISCSRFHSTKIFSILDQNFSEFEPPRRIQLPYSTLN